MAVGANFERMVVALAMIDDITLSAATWKNLAELYMCQKMISKQDPQRYSLFATRVTMNEQMLHEVSRQILNPTIRMATTVDRVMGAAPPSQIVRP